MTIRSEQLSEWERLCKEATPGEWVHIPSGTDGWEHAGVAVTVGKGWVCATDDTNAAFIAASRTALPLLIAEVRSKDRKLKKIIEHFGPMLRMMAEGATLHLSMTTHLTEKCSSTKIGPVMSPAEARALLKELGEE